MSGPLQIPITLKGEEKKYNLYISPPSAKDDVETLELALKNNRELLVHCQDKLCDTMKRDFFEYQPPWLLDYDSSIQTAIMARQNINILIPLINIRGGKADFTKIETMPVRNHVEKIMFKAEKAALEWQVESSSPMMYAIVVALMVAVGVIGVVAVK